VTSSRPHQPSPLAAEKAALRTAMMQVRAAIPPAHAEQHGQAAANQLAGLVQRERAKVVALYASFRDELGTLAAHITLSALGVLLVYPLVDKQSKTLSFHRVDDLATLIRSGFGVAEPSATHHLVQPLSSIDLFVVPGLAFDRSGGRLGWGQGYYDHTLNLASGARCAGYLYSQQLVPRVPVTPTDHPMDFLVSESWVHDTQRG
jgi:5-formyltetrahydrofolate cyclo-ligase